MDSNSKLNTEEIKNRKKNLFGSCYDFKETVGWLIRNGFGMSKKNRGIVEYIPNSFVVNEGITRKYTLTTIGDIMDLSFKNLKIGAKLNKYWESDFLIGNFEATITDVFEKPYLAAQRHKSQILDAFSKVFSPEKTYFSVANNHAGDYNKEVFDKSINIMEEKGFNVFGTKEKPYIDLNNNIRCTSGTLWSNLKCDWVSKIEDIQGDPDIIKENAFNIFYPHWGYEMELYPRKETVDLALNFIQDFDAVIGHHAHCPQPISCVGIDSIKKLISYSLGDFSTSLKIKKYQFGIILKMEIGLKNNQWLVGKLNWDFVKTTDISKDHVLVDIFEKEPFFLQ